MEKEIILEMKNIEKSFSGVKALCDASLNCYKGKVMALLGENGAGKSTLMKILSGIYKKDFGEIFYNGKKVQFDGVIDSQLAGIAIIHQELNLIQGLSIVENIFLGRELTNGLGKINWQLMGEEAKVILELINVKENLKTLVKDLTIGKQQMIEIAKALSQNAKLIIMDEPTDSLTDKETESLFNVIRNLKKKGKSVIYISHRLKEIAEICDDVTILRDGKFICEEEVSKIDENFIIKNMVGRELNEQFPKKEIIDGEEILRLEKIKGEFVHNASFSLKRSEVLGLTGLMGSGRTELAKTIFGRLKKYSGKIFLDNVEVSISSPKNALELGIVYVSEDRKTEGLIVGLDVLQNMTLSCLEKISSMLGIDKKREADEVEKYIKKFGIKTPNRRQLVKNLSGGNQQKISIAKALMTNPKVLILDEPTRGVDVGAKKEIYEAIKELKKEGMAIILISSEMPEILGLSDRVIVLYEQKIMRTFLPGEATQEKIMSCSVGVKNV
ncbi:MAG: sugar ABC transporter ATP-binding protein [Fusobacteriaceae bacterium]